MWKIVCNWLWLWWVVLCFSIYSCLHLKKRTGGGRGDKLRCCINGPTILLIIACTAIHPAACVLVIDGKKFSYSLLLPFPPTPLALFFTVSQSLPSRQGAYLSSGFCRYETYPLPGKTLIPGGRGAFHPGIGFASLSRSNGSWAYCFAAQGMTGAPTTLDCCVKR